MPYKPGDHVRVPDPEGDGSVEAVYIAPSEPGRKGVEFVWVRYAEGPHEGLNERVSYSAVEPSQP